MKPTISFKVEGKVIQSSEWRLWLMVVEGRWCVLLHLDGLASVAENRAGQAGIEPSGASAKLLSQCRGRCLLNGSTSPRLQHFTWLDNKKNVPFTTFHFQLYHSLQSNNHEFVPFSQIWCDRIQNNWYLWSEKKALKSFLFFPKKISILDVWYASPESRLWEQTLIVRVSSPPFLPILLW